jgi:hypothetical protein
MRNKLLLLISLKRKKKKEKKGRESLVKSVVNQKGRKMFIKTNETASTKPHQFLSQHLGLVSSPVAGEQPLMTQDLALGSCLSLNLWLVSILPEPQISTAGSQPANSSETQNIG